MDDHYAADDTRTFEILSSAIAESRLSPTGYLNRARAALMTLGEIYVLKTDPLYVQTLADLKKAIAALNAEACI